MQIKKLKLKQREYYKSIDSVYSPALNTWVKFTSSGFEHLIYHTNRKPRNINDQLLRLYCLQHVPAVITNCKNVTETRCYVINGKNYYYYELVHRINAKETIQVIVEKRPQGNYVFKSVMSLKRKKKASNKDAF